MWAIILFWCCLLPIIWEDFKSREVSLIWFLLLSLVTVLITVIKPPHDFWIQLSMNACFILLQLFLLSCYFSLKNRRWLWVTNGALGDGDIFFLAIIALFFPFLNYLFFYFASLIFTLLASVLFTLLNERKVVKLPLAGLQALFLVVLVTISLIFKIDIRSEDWLLNHLYHD